MNIPTEIMIISGIALIVIIVLVLGIGFFVTSRFKTLNLIFYLIILSLIVFIIGIPNSPVIEEEMEIRLLIIPLMLFGIANGSRRDTEVASIRVARRVFTAYVVHITLLVVTIFANLWVFNFFQ